RRIFLPDRRRSAKASLIPRFRSLRSSHTRFLCFRTKPSRARVCIGITTDAGGDACLLGSNILRRISISDDPQHAAVSHAASRAVRVGDTALLHLADAWGARPWNLRQFDRLDGNIGRAPPAENDEGELHTDLNLRSNRIKNDSPEVIRARD